jgi:hypothetical protein
MIDMMKKIIVVIVGIIASMGTGALIALWQCSQRRWCPRYLRRQLDAWYRQMGRQNVERHAIRKIQILKDGQDIPPDEAA